MPEEFHILRCFYLIQRNYSSYYVPRKETSINLTSIVSRSICHNTVKPCQYCNTLVTKILLYKLNNYRNKRVSMASFVQVFFIPTAVSLHSSNGLIILQSEQKLGWRDIRGYLSWANSWKSCSQIAQYSIASNFSSKQTKTTDTARTLGQEVKCTRVTVRIRFIILHFWW